MNLFILILLMCVKVHMIACESYCETFLECGSCIGYASEICVWCSAENHTGPRCTSKEKLKDKLWCDETIVDPLVTFLNYRSDNFSSGESGTKVVQFKPQAIKLKARPGLPVYINMAYKPATDYPLDIYYLMDYSKTMVDHAAALRDQGNEIYQEMSKITNNVRLGVGSFVDKSALPYANPEIHLSYSFKNHLSLTKETAKFRKALAKVPDGSNYDKPEAGFDALMQAMVCKKELGWRENARRIIVLSTDSTYHSAGDGKIVGAFRPHDMKCHVVNNTYTKELELDYPSVNKINKVASENNFMIIFAAVESVASQYKPLEKVIKGSKYVPLKKNSKLVDIIKSEYLSLIQNVQLGYKIPSFMEFIPDQDCTKQGECNVKHKQSLELTGTLKVKSCPLDKQYTQVIEVGPLMLDEKLKIQVEIDCECDCEKPGRGLEDSDACDNMGTYQCGVCKCKENRRGKQCQCDGSSSEQLNEDDCRFSNDTLLCNGHGTCNCGKCESCSEGYWGTYCEHDNTACLGVRCSMHGVCKEGSCECSDGWSGKYCDCSPQTDTCKDPYSNKECSGNGKCVCGVCKCDTCFGEFCNDCKAIENCKNFEDFAYCNLKESKSDCERKYHKTNTEVTILNKTQVNSPDYYIAKYWCRKVVEDDKIFLFKYYYSNGKLHLIIQNELENQPVAKVWITVGSVIGAILLIGILTLIGWKILVDFHDKREYEKFAQKAAAAGFHEIENPTYVSPATNFTNPAYNENMECYEK